LAEIGRFISVDPVLDGMNWYSYCNNNPLVYVDPTGMLSDPVTTTTTTATVIDGFVKYGQYIENQFISAPPIVSPQKLAAADGPIPVGDVAALLVGSFMIIGYNVELIADFIWAKAGELKAKEQEKRTEQKLNESLPAGYTHEDGNYHNSKGEIVSQEEILAAKEKEIQTELQRPLPPGYKRLDDGKIVNEEGKLVPNTCCSPSPPITQPSLGILPQVTSRKCRLKTKGISNRRQLEMPTVTVPVNQVCSSIWSS